MMNNCCEHIREYPIYQGEPLGGVFNVVGDDGEYLESLEGFNLEMMLYDNFGNITAQLSTDAGGGITIGTEVIEGKTRGTAAWCIGGTETAKMAQGQYTLELARRIEGGRGIGQLVGLIVVVPARIRNGLTR